MKSKNFNSKSLEDFEHELLRLKNAHDEMKRQNDDANSMAKWHESLKIRDFFNRSFVMSCILIAGHEINGVFTMTNYASVIFSESGSTLSPGMSSIIVAAIQFVGSYISCLLVDRLGRKVSFSLLFQFRLNQIDSHFFLTNFLFRSAIDGGVICWDGHRSAHFGDIYAH